MEAQNDSVQKRRKKNNRKTKRIRCKSQKKYFGISNRFRSEVWKIFFRKLNRMASFRSPKEFQSEVEKNSFRNPDTGYSLRIQFNFLKEVHLKAQNHFVQKSNMISLGRQKWSRSPKIIQFRKKCFGFEAQNDCIQ